VTSFLSFMSLLLLVPAAVAAKVCGNGSGWQCPPVGFTSVSGFSLEAYAARPWFVQQQVITSPSSSPPCRRFATGATTEAVLLLAAQASNRYQPSNNALHCCCVQGR